MQEFDEKQAIADNLYRNMLLYYHESSESYELCREWHEAMEGYYKCCVEKWSLKQARVVNNQPRLQFLIGLY